MGSVPINQPLLIFISTMIEIILGSIGIFLFMMTSSRSSDDDDPSYAFLLLLLSGFIYYFVIYNRYRNKNARHTYEKETNYEISNLVKKDELIKRERGLDNSEIKGRNDHVLEGEKVNIQK